MGQTPKLRDAARTRGKILRAAQDLFAAGGYTHTGLRDIAARAGIDVSLVARYFGSKEQLFRAAFSDLVFPATLPGRPTADFGKAVVGLFIDEDDHAIKPMFMLVRAAAEPDVAATIRELVTTQILVPLSAWLGGDDAPDRAAKILALCAGFFTYRVLVPLPAFSGALAPDVRAWLERSIQDVVDRKG